MTYGEGGYWAAEVDNCPPGTRYFYRLNGSTDRPDPASRLQPECVHGPSEVCADRGLDAHWPGLPLNEYILYELHVGTFSMDGTFDGIIPQLQRLKELGITAIELMPVAEFPGARNWGYDGVYPFAVEHSYGGVAALRRLVGACHDLGLAVVLDVVYNHLGPEGNYLREFGPYFTDRYRTPWGDALNFDGPDSDPVRRYFIENALYWIEDCGVDALRLDAVHAIYDKSAYPFLRELAESVHRRANELGRYVYLIAETDLNDSRIVTSIERGGLGLDAQWSDDFHHALHTVLTGEARGYYADFGRLAQLATAIQEGWIYQGQYSHFRRARFGNSPATIDAHQLVVCSQNHDQVGNRMYGERLIHLVGQKAAGLAAATVLLSPYIPLLFMGEEYGETAPFLYHVSHSDPDLQEAVRQGRKQEFAGLFVTGSELPDPQDEKTFADCKLNTSLRDEGSHAQLYEWYSKLLKLRKSHPAVRTLSKASIVVDCQEESQAILIPRRPESPEREQAIVILHFGHDPHEVDVYLPSGEWSVILDSEDMSRIASPILSESECFKFTLAPQSCLVLSGTAASCPLPH